MNSVATEQFQRETEMDELTPLQFIIFLAFAGVSVVVIANAILDVYVRHPSARFFYPRRKHHQKWFRSTTAE